MAEIGVRSRPTDSDPSSPSVVTQQLPEGCRGNKISRLVVMAAYFWSVTEVIAEGFRHNLVLFESA
jgi:hypothetical protein